jgi:excisionase family DNA binding protein
MPAMASARDLKRERTLDHKAAAEFLGVDSGTLYNWVGKRKITVIKMGRKNVYRERDLVEFMDRRIQQADAIE